MNVGHLQVDPVGAVTALGKITVRGPAFEDPSQDKSSAWFSTGGSSPFAAPPIRRPISYIL